MARLTDGCEFFVSCFVSTRVPHWNLVVNLCGVGHTVLGDLILTEPLVSIENSSSLFFPVRSFKEGTIRRTWRLYPDFSNGLMTLTVTPENCFTATPLKDAP